MDSLSNTSLFKSDGSSVIADSALEGKDLVLYYFSAHWCPPCRQFTPMLKDFYEEAEGLEIVFVSSDKSPEDMISYMKESHGDWLAVPHNSAVANDLKQKYGQFFLINNKMGCFNDPREDSTRTEVCGWVGGDGGWLTPTTYIQLAGAG